MKLDRLGDITSELSSNLVKSIVVPGGLLDWLSKPLGERLRDRLKPAATGGKSSETAEGPRNLVAEGPLVLVGGAPIPDEAVVAIIHLAGGRTAKLAIIPLAADDQSEAVAAATRAFTRFGMRNVELFELVTRERAESPEWAEKLAAFDAVCLCGDNAAKGLDVLRDTVSLRTLREMMAAGKPVAGFSAGAAILAERLLLVRNGEEVLAEGTGLAPGLLLETRFIQQAGFSRLAKALNSEAGQSLMGVGLDAGAAIAIRDAEARIMGDASVMFLDPRDRDTVNENTGTTAGTVGLKVHVLTDGYGMNLRLRKPISLTKENPPLAGER